MKMKYWVVTIVVFVVVFIFGKNTIIGYLYGAKDEVKAFTSEHTPTSMDVSLIDRLIKNESVKVEKFSEEMIDLEEKISVEREKVRKYQEEIDRQKRGLMVAKGLIEEGRNAYFIAGRNRTLTEIEDDAASRVKYVTTLESQLNLSNNLIDTLVKTERSCRTNLHQARKSILAKQIELEQLKAREMNAEIQAKAASLSNSLTGMSDSILNHSELQNAMKVYAAKINSIERKSGQISQSNSPWIEYNPEGTEDPNLMAQIDNVILDKAK